MKQHKICIITGSRADYGLFKPLMDCVRADRSSRLQVIATGSHLEASFGNSWREITRDGFKIDAKIPILSKATTVLDVTRAIGLAVQGIGKALVRLRPDIVILLGDRYEILAAAQAALIAKIPVAHIAGGDITMGALDDSIRHAITKMSHLHFATHAAAARRIRQLGEDPRMVLNAGHIGLDSIRNMDRVDRPELEKILKFKFRPRNLLITFHPSTLDATPSIKQLGELLSALDRLGPDTGLIFTAANADTEGIKMNQKIKGFSAVHGNACFVPSMGRQRYLNAMKYVDAVVGNSSSGIYEAPSFKIPTVNIGDRQQGRQQAASVLNCPPEASRIYRTILAAYKKDCSKVINPYGDGRSAPRILRVIKKIRNLKKLLKKRFREI